MEKCGLCCGVDITDEEGLFLELLAEPLEDFCDITHDVEHGDELGCRNISKIALCSGSFIG